MIRGKAKIFFKIEGGNSGLTEEFIYSNQPNNEKESVTVYSGATQKNNMLKKIKTTAKIKNKNIKLFDDEGILIIRKGKAGNLIHITDKRYTLNDDAYIMQIREKYKDKINIKYLLFAINNEIEKCITSNNGGNQTFNKTLFDESIIELPDLTYQNKLVEEYEKLYKIKRKVEENIDKVNDILKSIPKCTYGDIHKIEDVFYIVSENRKMTEEYIYNHQGIYPVYSAQIDGAYGYVNSYNFDGEILSVVNYGDSGKTTLRKGKLTIGRNACGLLPKEEYKDKILLKFAKYALQEVFVNNAKGTDLKSLSQATINSTEFFLPDKKEQQEIAVAYEKLEMLVNQLKKIESKINELVNC